MRHYTYRRCWQAALLGALVPSGGCSPSDPPLIRIEARASRFDIQSTTTTGLVRVRLVNRDTSWHEANLTRLTGAEGTLSNYLAKARAGEEYPAFSHDVGGPTLVAPGDSLDVMLRLTEGRYLVLSWHRDDALAGFAAEFQARGPDAPHDLPRDAQDVVLSDYSIGPMTARRGAAMLHVMNRGRHEHEITILRLEAGKKADDYYAWKNAGEVGNAPAVPVAGTSALAAGAEVWVPLQLEPGNYVALCSVETIGANAVPRHYALGMQQRFTVPE
ncbi:MAG: hypothetical protein ABI969_10025 [bacterium]